MALVQWRLREGLTLLQAAARAKCDPSTLNKIERRRRRPGRDLSAKLEALAGIARDRWKRVQLAS